MQNSKQLFLEKRCWNPLKGKGGCKGGLEDKAKDELGRLIVGTRAWPHEVPQISGERIGREIADVCFLMGQWRRWTSSMPFLRGQQCDARHAPARGDNSTHLTAPLCGRLTFALGERRPGREFLNPRKQPLTTGGHPCKKQHGKNQAGQGDAGVVRIRKTNATC